MARNDEKLCSDTAKIPEEFFCPLTLDMMVDPVMTRWGNSFEREALIRWMGGHDYCPVTRKPLSLADVLTDRALKSRIQVWNRVNSLGRSNGGIPEPCNGQDDDCWECSAVSPFASDQMLSLLVDVGSTDEVLQTLQKTHGQTYSNPATMINGFKSQRNPDRLRKIQPTTEAA